ncbi:MAG: glycosyltransferase, partial [bacterium]
ANFYGRIAAIVNKVPIIIASERNLPDIGKDKNINQIFIDKLLALRTTAIICNSQIAAETLIKKYSYKRDKVFTVHNGINRIGISNEKQTLRKNAQMNRRIVTVGWFRPQKNHRLFFDMAKLVLERSKNENLKFVLIGDGVLRHNLEKYSLRLGIERNIIFTGKRHKVLELLNYKDIFVLTSLYEGLCNSIMEAMMVGLPVVATDVGGNSELVIDGETGFLCPSNNADALADKVCYLLNNEYKAKSFGENGRLRILNEFGVDKMQKKTQDIYLNLLHKQNKIPLTGIMQVT